MAPQISKNILLTGAGFTKNFGGFVATEMWEKIFNCSEVQDSPVLIDILRNDLGSSLKEASDVRVMLCHPRCYACFSGGTSCSEL